MAWNKLLVVVVAGALAACSNEMNVTDTGTNNDSGTSDATVTDSSPQDTGTTGDTGTTTDVPSTADTGTGGDGGGMFGTCGMATNTCLCGCGNNATCQQGCFSDMTCQRCIVEAQGMCCPTEANAYVMCAQAAMTPGDAGPACASNDAACIQARCGSEITAFQNCVNTASMNDATCQGYLAGCLGNYPIQCM